MLPRLALSSIIALSCAAPLFAAPLPKPPAFAMCAACHKVDKGAPNTLGPNLWGIAGSKAGEHPGFTSSPAMKKSNIKWTRDKLLAYIQDPQKTVPGTRMPFGGIKNPQSAAAVADYLMSLK